jgi:DNA-binding CsgD family transcriptional regulator
MIRADESATPRRAMPTALLQRDAELAVVGRLLGAVRAGSGRLIVVEGPAGIGKSSLLRAAALDAVASGVRVLRAWGGPLEQDAGWGIARQLFGPLYHGPEWAELAVGAASLARRALDPDAAEPSLAGDAVHAAAHGLTWLACTLADRGPALLMVDDVQWADAPSLRWLIGLARQLPEIRLGVVCAVRSGDPSSEPMLLAELLAAAAEEPVRPAPLGPSAVELLVRERLPTAKPVFSHACHAATAGNPFLVGSLLDHVLAERLDPSDDVAARLSSFGPQQVVRTVERQLARLPDGATAMARAFAVLGRGALLRQARDLAGLDTPTAATVADRLCAAGLLRVDEGTYALVHPLIAGALYSGLADGERALWHARAARQLRRERADPEAVALHLLHGEPSQDADAVAVLRSAAARATTRGAPESAATFLRRALSEPPPSRAVEADVRSELGLALAAHLQLDAPAMLHEAVRLADSATQRSRIALSAARALGLAGHFADAIQACRQGLQGDGGNEPDESRGGPHDDPRDNLHDDPRDNLRDELICNAWLQETTVAEARERQRAIAQPTPSSLWRINAAWQAMAEARPATESLELLHSAVRSGALQAQPDSLLNSITKFGLAVNGDLATALELCDALIDVARPRGWLIALAHGSFLRAIALNHAGRIRDAETDARLSFDYKRGASPPGALLWSIFPLVDALTELDQLADADTALATVGQLGEPPAGALAAPMLLESRARLRLAQGRPREAHADALAASARWDALGIRHPGVAGWRVDAVAALVALDDVDAARQLAEEHLGLAERVGLAEPLAAGLRALALTTGRAEAISTLERAVDLLGDGPEHLERVRVLVELGSVHRRANRRAAAADPLRLALDQADRGGMLRGARRARAELQAVGVRPRRTALTGVEALTPAEHQVAGLAARGFSNPEIAQQLYVTRRTVETHLTHVFQKLELTSRAQLARGLLQDGVVAGSPAVPRAVAPAGEPIPAVPEFLG